MYVSPLCPCIILCPCFTTWTTFVSPVPTSLLLSLPLKWSPCLMSPLCHYSSLIPFHFPLGSPHSVHLDMYIWYAVNLDSTENQVTVFLILAYFNLIITSRSIHFPNWCHNFILDGLIKFHCIYFHIFRSCWWTFRFHFWLKWILPQ